MKSKIKIFLIVLLLTSISLMGSVEKLEASKTLSLVLNDKDITSKAMPVIENGRTLVPVRFISEELGAEVIWNGNDKTVLIKNGVNSILLKIGSRLITYNGGEDYQLSDVEPKLINTGKETLTYVPLRLIGNALDIGVGWDPEESNVYIDSNKAVDKEAISAVEIISQNRNQKINGETSIQIATEKEYKEDTYIEFLLLEKGETNGFIIGKGNDISGKYTYTPKIEDNGHKILVARVYDKSGRYLDGDAIPIEIKVEPKVYLSGVNKDDIIKGTVKLSTEANFFPLYVKYEIKKLVEVGEGKEILTDINDPLGTYTWNPIMKDNGVYSIRAIAYDAEENPYYSQPIIVGVDRERALTLGGVKDNMVIDRAVNLIANRNFDVSETEYFIRDVKTGKVSSLAKMPYGDYKWNPGPDDSGTKELFVKVVDRGRTYESNPIRVEVDGQAKIFLEGIKQEQITNKNISLNINSNVQVDNIKYIITNTNTGQKQELTPQGESNEIIYSPRETDKSNMIVEAQGKYKGKIISSDKIKFHVYHGEFFGSKPIVEKDEFLSLVSKPAVNSFKETGMSAAIITAQAILETGWGQSVPVDKYTGLLSNNLFGIKSKDGIGSVTSNTWEVYNGQEYRIDAGFRAYNTIDESLKDHRKFLLNGERYKPFTQVMYDYTKGSWALKRAGYATDPDYALKLIRIINSRNLYELDKVGI